MMPIMLLRPEGAESEGEDQLHGRSCSLGKRIIDLCVFLTCRDKEYTSTEDYVVAGFVELTGSYTHTSKEQQSHTEDGEEAGGSYCS